MGRGSTYDTVIGGVGFDDLELDGSHTTADEEEIALANGSVGFEEVGLEVDLEEVSGDALDSVVDREDMDALSVLDISAGVKRDDISKTDTQVLADDCGTRSHHKVWRKKEKKKRRVVLVRMSYNCFLSICTQPSHRPFLTFAIILCNHNLWLSLSLSLFLEIQRLLSVCCHFKQKLSTSINSSYASFLSNAFLSFSLIQSCF